MTKLKDLHEKMMKGPSFRAEYDALEEEFAALSAKAKLFEDLGIPNPEHEALRADLTLKIYRIIRRRRLSEAQIAATLGVNRTKTATLMRNRPGNLTVDELVEFLTALE